ncbi:MAG TPA: ATP-dependent DNA ligase, partial [Rubrivivax sp.]|nr:ATP-dependent DNA ligase [Rubrivivax sp.]
PLRGLPPSEQAERLNAAWDELDAGGRFLFVKLIGGGFRVGVSRLLVQRAVAEHAGLDARLVAQRLVGWTDARTTPSAAHWQALVAKDAEAAPPAGQPYPFFLAHALQAEPSTLGPRSDWLVEWKYDGIRAQVVKRAGQVWIWSRGEELVTERFPEVVTAAATLPDGTVLDGELLVWFANGATPAPFNLLQQRIGRKTVGRKLLAEAPVVFVAYDLLEAGGVDRRDEPQHERRQHLQALLQGQALRLSPLVEAPDWAACAVLREQSRRRGVEGFMLKHRQARYGSGRTKAGGIWWKWKVEPFTVDAVLVYAQAGHGRRAGVYTDYTFAVWSRPPASEAEAQAVVEAIARREPARPGALQLLPFAKAYSGLSDGEFKAVDRVVRAHTLEKFGPVRSVRPTLVFEIGFEGIGASPRHKSGVAVRFPRMLRLRPDKPLHEADSLATLHALMGAPPWPRPGAEEGEEWAAP